MPYLTGVVFDEESPTFYPAQWKDYWVRTWGARGLLYVWDESPRRPWWPGSTTSTGGRPRCA